MHPLVGRVLCGRMPGVRLDEAGRQQALRLAARLARGPAAALYTSPLERARETASAIAEACRLPCSPCEALNELDFGDWTGAAFGSLEGDPAWSRWNQARAESCPPGGESMRQAQARVLVGIRRFHSRHPDGTVIAVSHADIIKAALMWCLGLSLDAHQRFDIDPASISGMVLWDGGGKVLWMNERVTA